MAQWGGERETSWLPRPPANAIRSCPQSSTEPIRFSDALARVLSVDDSFMPAMHGRSNLRTRSSTTGRDAAKWQLLEAAGSIDPTRTTTALSMPRQKGARILLSDPPAHWKARTGSPSSSEPYG